ncbi:Outer membrane protein beta-barrel domain-containing protein [Algoriphagus alkaliphilus]|uniref:Outer membrane protein beta-barrel domain-containing protein n=2 Tax=Algoriphagus alkaliphilus TaxID=279824 RepID=A0A1G5VC82_9BACT|nr:Outer membrane protein beta-barrel domain-containing protein [Algoriphagus alkaliphilus]
MTKSKKSAFLIIMSLFLGISAHSQQGSGFGFKGGMNFNTSGKYFKDAGQIFSSPSENMGYHLGVFFQLSSYDISLRPEMIYTKSKFETSLGAVDYQKVDLPVLVKMRLFKVIGFSIGPSLHYTFEEKFSVPENFQKTEPFGLGFQMGLGVNIGPVGLDLRFEREMNERKYSFENVLGKEDYKNQQLILGLSFMIPGKRIK